MEKREVHTEFWSEGLKRREHSGGLGICGGTQDSVVGIVTDCGLEGRDVEV
jgi:hypothetical protein